MREELVQYMWLRQQWHDLRGSEAAWRGCSAADAMHGEWDTVLDTKLIEILAAWESLTPDERSHAAVLTDIRWPHDNDKYEAMLADLSKYQVRGSST